MKNLLFIFLLVASAFPAALNLLTWDGSKDHNINDTANWTGTVASGATLGVGDSLLINDIDEDGTASASLKVGAIVLGTGYSGNWSMATYGCTTTVWGQSYDNGGGNLTLAAVAVNGDFHVGSIGSLSLGAVTFTAAGNFDIDEASWISTGVNIAGAYAATHTSAVTTGRINGGAATPLTIANSGTWTNNQTVAIITSGTFTSVGTGVTANGTGTTAWRVVTAGATGTMPAWTYTGTGATAINNSGASAGGAAQTFILSGNQDYGSSSATSMLNAVNNAASGFTFNTANYNITCGTIYWGSSTNAGTAITKWGSSTITCQGILNTGDNATATQLDSFGTCKFRVIGSITMNLNHQENAGTSEFRTLGATKSSRTSNRFLYYDVVDSLNAGVVDSLIDSMQVGHDYTLLEGVLKTGGQNITVTGNFTAQGSGRVIARMAKNYLTMTNGGTVNFATTGKDTLDSITVQFTKSSTANTFLYNDSIRIYSIGFGGSNKRRLNLQTGKKLTINAYTAGALDGAAGSLCSLYTTDITAAAEISAPTNMEIKYVVCRGIYSDQIMHDTIGGINRLYNTNIIFKDANGLRYQSGATVVTITSLTNSWSDTSGGGTCAVVGTGFYAPCSIQVEGSATWLPTTVTDSTHLSFTFPAHAPGVADVTILNCDSTTGTKGNAIYYTIKPTLTGLSHPAGWIGYVDTAQGHNLKLAGGSAVLNPGGIAVTINSHDTSIIRWVTPTAARGSYYFVFSDSVGQKCSTSFRVLVPDTGTAIP